MQHFLKNVGIGAIVAFLGLCLAVGPANAGFAVAIAVVCTGGIGLVPMVIGSYLLGLFLTTLWWAGQTVSGATGGAAEMPRLSPEEEAVAPLAEYIRKARKKGRPDEATEVAMQDAGWRPEEIGRAKDICARWRAHG